MSRRTFFWFGTLFPLGLSAFIVFAGRIDPKQASLPAAMENLAVGLILFFSFLSWCIVRSNKRTPARIDYPSLLVGVTVLIVFVSGLVGDVSKSAAQPGQISNVISPIK